MTKVMLSFKLVDTKRVIYLFLMSTSAILGLLKFFIFSKLVSVENFGLYSLVMSLYIFVVFIGGMGLQEGLIKKGAECYAINDVDTIKKYFINATVGSIVNVLTLGFFFAIGVRYFTEDSFVLQMVLIGGGLALSAILFNTLGAYLRSNHKFNLFAFLLFLKGVSVLLLGYFLSFNYGAQGLVLAEFLSLFLVFIASAMIVIKPADFHLVKGLNVALELVLNGYQMMISIVLRNIALMIDKWFAALTVGALAFGFYSFSMILLSMTMISIGFIVTLKGPIWIASFQSEKNPKLLFREISNTIIKIITGLLLVFPLVFMYLPEALQLAYPKYANEEVFWLFIVVYISVLFIVPIYLYDWIFIATSNEGATLLANVLTLIFSFFIFLLCWMVNASVLFFAIAFLLSRLFLLLNYFYHLYKKGYVCVY